MLIEEKIAIPDSAGTRQRNPAHGSRVGICLDGATIVEPERLRAAQEYVHEFYRLRQRRGVTLGAADELMNDRNIFGSMMVRMGDADAIVSGVTQNYPDTIRPALQVIGVREGIHKVSRRYLIITRKGDLYFLADATVNIEPTAEDLAEIALCAAQEARRFDIEPRVAMLSFSSFGSTKHPLVRQGSARGRTGSLRRSHAHHRRRNAGRHRGQRQEDGSGLPLLRVEGRSQRADLPRPAILQYRLQAAAAASAEQKPWGRSSRAWRSRCTCCSAASRSRTSST